MNRRILLLGKKSHNKPNTETKFTLCYLVTLVLWYVEIDTSYVEIDKSFSKN